MFDVAVGLIAWRRFGRYPRLLVAREYVQGRASGRLARALGVIPVDRGRGRSDAIGAAVASLRAGRSVLVMPEGRLHVDPVDRTTTGRAHTGVARIAWAARAPVMAAAVVGSDEVWPKEARYPRPRLGHRRLVTVRIADQPLWLQGQDARADTERVMVAIRELLRSAEQEWCRFDVDRR
jgi:1-acyl-sn-glycerol-3-phosphate acyltransferase